jgi:hypothetical protein
MAGYRVGRLNFGVWQNPLVLGSTFLYVLHSVLRQFFPEPWFLQFYLNDLLCMPIVLGAAIFLQRNLVLRQPAYALTGYQIAIVVIYWSVMFEGVIPKFVERYTADIFDVIAYSLGGLLFYLFGNSGQSDLVRRHS